MQTLGVHHSTVYRYAKPVRFGEHQLMFRPRDSHDLRLLETRLVIASKCAWVQIYLPGAGWVKFDPS